MNRIRKEQDEDVLWELYEGVLAASTEKLGPLVRDALEADEAESETAGGGQGGEPSGNGRKSAVVRLADRYCDPDPDYREPATKMLRRMAASNLLGPMAARRL